MHDLLQQLQILHREEHVYLSPSPRKHTLKVQVLNVIHVVVQDCRENHLQLLITQLRSYLSHFFLSLTHEAQHFNVSHIAAFQERLQHIAVNAIKIHLYASPVAVSPTTQTQRADVGAVRCNERLHEQLHCLWKDRPVYSSHKPLSSTHADAEELGLVCLQVLNQLQEVR